MRTTGTCEPARNSSTERKMESRVAAFPRGSFGGVLNRLAARQRIRERHANLYQVSPGPGKPLQERHRHSFEGILRCHIRNKGLLPFCHQIVPRSGYPVHRRFTGSCSPRARLGIAGSSTDENLPSEARMYPAIATIAPLSVQYSILGMNSLRPRRFVSASSLLRSSEFAATPPARARSEVP